MCLACQAWLLSSGKEEVLQNDSTVHHSVVVISCNGPPAPHGQPPTFAQTQKEDGI